MNIEDIARLAGVSRSTISRVLNNHSDVSERTRQRVMQVIEKYNYKPNPAARTLVTQRTRVIGVLISNPVTVFASSYLPTLLHGIADATHERDYATLLWWGRSGEEEERFTRRILHANTLMEGVIIVFHTIDNTLIRRALDTKLPFVIVERPTTHVDKINFVTVDNFRGAELAVDHLVALGRRRIGHITGHVNMMDAIERLTGYRNALAKHHLPYNPNWVVEGEFDVDSGYRAMKTLLVQGVDAVFAGNDNSAIGALQALRDAGIQVPDEISIVGFDDLPPVMTSSPPLTTIHQPVREKGAQAAHILLDMLEGKITEPQQRVLPVHLVIRESCGIHLKQKEA